MATTKVTANVLADNSVTQAKLADDAVGADELAANAVVNASIASGADIDMDKLDGDSLANAITDFAQDDLVILSDTSASGNLVKITTSDFEDAIFGNISGDATVAAGGALTIANNAVETAMINADAITGAKIADNAIDSEHYTDGSIDTAHLAADAVTGAKIADDAIDSEHYTDGSIDTAHLGDLQVTTAKIAADAITGAKLADDAVDSEHYTDGSIDNAHIADNQISYEKVDDEFSTVDALSAGATVNIDFDAAQVFTLTPNQNTTFNVTNPKIGITKTMIVTGAGSSYTADTWTVGGASGTFNRIAGEYDDTSSTKNFYQITCVSATEFWYSISQIAS